jgi:hypothetical protein
MKYSDYKKREDIHRDGRHKSSYPVNDDDRRRREDKSRKSLKRDIRDFY